MVSHESTGIRRPSSWWLFLAALATVLAAVAAFVALHLQREATRPIGEGIFFVAEAATADGIVNDTQDPDSGVRMARNTLGVEAVSLVDPAGVIISSTSTPLVGQLVGNEMLHTAAVEHRFSALAGPIPEDLWLDGVIAWPAGSVLYQVVSPSELEAHSLLLHYDVASLLGRRTPPGTLRPATVELLVVAAALVVVAAGILVARARAARRYREVVVESELLRKHSQELELANAELQAARAAAEEALALAEEKIRIRSEFVLMINHELRTPLTSVVTGADLLRTTEMTDSERGSLIDSIAHDGNRLLEIVDQILAVARIENRGISYELSEIPMEELCSALCTGHAPPPGDCGRDDVLVNTDLKAVESVVAALVDNARTHGATEVSVVCSSAPTVGTFFEVGDRPSEAVYLSVIDNGPGIDSEFLPRAFEKFEKSGFSSGTGLGLYMARMVVESLTGSIAVESSPAGSTFQIALPVSAVRARTGSPT
ncbi:MAG: HAMP domain-containing sensor histidine kinase [Acidimicrobiia bacterium]